MKRNLKLLYFLTLAALCLYVTTGPVVADSVPMIGFAPYTFTNAVAWVANNAPEGVANWEVPPYFYPYSGSGASLDLDLSCDAACAATVDFKLDVGSDGYVKVSLNGSSTDSTAGGDVDVVLGPPETIEQSWSVSGTSLSMESFSFPVYLAHVSAEGQSGEYDGYFTISLPDGGELNMDGTSLDFNATSPPSPSVPEPASVLLLGSVLLSLGFLRRKAYR
jgi:hypothetical protein